MLMAINTMVEIKGRMVMIALMMLMTIVMIVTVTVVGVLDSSDGNSDYVDCSDNSALMIQ